MSNYYVSNNLSRTINDKGITTGAPTAKISFFTPLNYQCYEDKTIGDRITQWVDSFFFWGGEKAYVTSSKCLSDVESFTRTFRVDRAFSNTEEISKTRKALLLGSYVLSLGTLPLVLLITKCFLRSVRYGELKDKYVFKPMDDVDHNIENIVKDFKGNYQRGSLERVETDRGTYFKYKLEMKGKDKQYYDSYTVFFGEKTWRENTRLESCYKDRILEAKQARVEGNKIKLGLQVYSMQDQKVNINGKEMELVPTLLFIQHV